MSQDSFRESVQRSPEPLVPLNINNVFDHFILFYALQATEPCFVPAAMRYGEMANNDVRVVKLYIVIFFPLEK